MSSLFRALPLRSVGPLAFALTILGIAACSSQSGSVVLTRQPQTFLVQAGAENDQQANQGLDFYPSSSVTIDAGDTVKWTYPAGEPHTVTLLGAGQASPPPSSDPNVAAPAGTSTYDGSTYTSSGFLMLGKSYSLTFPKAGTYKVYCLIHQPEMVQTIVVQPAGSPYPKTQSAIDSAIASESAADLAAALAADKLFPYTPNGLHLAAGISPGTPTGPSTNSTVMRFFATTDPGTTTTTVPVGSTVTWTNLANNVPHTVTFAPVGQPFPEIDPFAPASGGTSYDGSTLVNSGPLFPGQSVSITFPKAGTYSYHCLFHDDTENMIATLVVQ